MQLVSAPVDSSETLLTFELVRIALLARRKPDWPEDESPKQETAASIVSRQRLFKPASRFTALGAPVGIRVS
jgi:hypothetical protein